jgi:hypothetical protein
MPSTRKADAEVVMDVEVLTSRTAELDHFTVGFDEYHVTADGTPVFQGLPDGRCQYPHWDIVVKGEITMQYLDGDETYRAGDAYYARPGHVPALSAGSATVGWLSGAAEERARVTEPPHPAVGDAPTQDAHQGGVQLGHLVHRPLSVEQRVLPVLDGPAVGKRAEAELAQSLRAVSCQRPGGRDERHGPGHAGVGLAPVPADVGVDELGKGRVDAQRAAVARLFGELSQRLLRVSAGPLEHAAHPGRRRPHAGAHG